MEIPQRASLLKQATDILRRGLQEGVWAERMPAERILADELQVSRPTVRAALKVLQREGWVRISQGKQTQVVKRRGSGVAARKAVTLLTPEPLHAMSGSDHLVINELRRYLQNADYQLELCSDARFNARDPQTALKKQLLRSTDSVWILHTLNAGAHQFFRDRGLTALAFGSAHETIDIPAFDVDFRAACRHAAGQFLRKGHRRIGLVTPKTGLAGDVAGEEGFREAFEVSSHDDARPLIISHTRTVKSLCAAVDRVTQMPSPPTGLLVSHPPDVLTVLTHLLRSGFRVPEDMSLISRGYAAHLDHIVPRVACYRVDWVQYARRFSRAVVQLAETGTLARQSTLVAPDFHNGDTLAHVASL